MLTLEVKNFGPIAKGSVDLKPLTVFVGPNNTGKSYMAMLTYAAHHAAKAPFFPYALFGSAWIRYERSFLHDFGFLTPEAEKILKSEKGRTSIHDWLEERTDGRELGVPETIGSLPLGIQQAFDQLVGQFFEKYTAGLGTEIGRCFGTELEYLLRSGQSYEEYSISVRQSSPRWSLEFGLSSNKKNLNITKQEFDFSQTKIEIPPSLYRPRARVRRPKGEDLVGLGELLLQESFSAFYRTLFPDSYYLPAARSGILQSHKLLAGFLVSRSALVGIEKFDIPQLSGVVLDFISSLIRLNPRAKTRLQGIARFLEEEAIGGAISFQTDALQYPELYYEAKGLGRLPILRTSSMVSELAPIVVFLRHLVDPEDLLIIEEPESHLHPYVQRRLVRGLVKLARANASVLITTHSDYILEQVSNFIRLGLIDSKDRVKMGYDEEDFLKPDEIGVYHFTDGGFGPGSVVEQLPVHPNEGISDPDFQKVSDSLYQETTGLQRRLLLD